MKKLFILLTFMMCISMSAQQKSLDISDGTSYKAMTTTERDALTILAGEKVIINNTTTGNLELWNGSGWINFEASASTDGLGPDGDTGDITIGGGGTTTQIEIGAVTSAKILDGTITEDDLSANAPTDEYVLTWEETGNLLEWQPSSTAGVFSGSLAIDQLAFGSGADAITGSNDLLWDDTNLMFRGSSVDRFIRFSETAAQFNGAFIQYEGGTNKFHLGVHATGDAIPGNDTKVFTMQRADGFIGINNVSPGYELDLTGTFNSDGALIAPTYTNFAGGIATGGVPRFGGSRLGDSDIQSDSYDIGTSINWIDGTTPQQVNWTMFENNDVMTLRSSNNDIGVLDVNGANGALYGTDDTEATIAQTIVFSDTKTYVNDLGVQRYEPGATDVGQSFFHVMANRNGAPRMKYYQAFYDGTTYDEISRINTDGSSLWAYDLEAASLTVTGGSSDDILLGDGTTTSLATITGDYIPLAGSSAVTGSIVPSIDQTINLGSPTKDFLSIYSTSFEGGAFIGSNLEVLTASTGSYHIWGDNPTFDPLGFSPLTGTIFWDNTAGRFKMGENGTSTTETFSLDNGTASQFKMGDGSHLSLINPTSFTSSGGVMTYDTSNRINVNSYIIGANVDQLRFTDADGQPHKTTIGHSGITTESYGTTNSWYIGNKAGAISTVKDSTRIAIRPNANWTSGVLEYDYDDTRWEIDGNEISTGAGGDVTKVGTPVNNQIAIWTGDGTLEGETGLTWDGSFIETDDTVLSGIKMSNPTGTGQMWNNGNLHIKGEATNFGNTLISGTTTQFKLTEAGSTIAQVDSGGFDVTGDISVTGTVDGIDIATDVAANTAKVGLTDGDKGDITIGSSGTTFSIDADAITEADLKAVNAPTDEYFLTYEATTGDFEWQASGGGTPTLAQVLTAGNDGGTNNITNVGDITSASVSTNSLSIEGASSQQSGTTFNWNGINIFTTTAGNYFRLMPTDIEPTPAAKGMLYFDDSESTLKQHNGTSWGTYALAADYLPLAGGTMTGNINIGSNSITDGAGNGTFSLASGTITDQLTANLIQIGESEVSDQSIFFSTDNINGYNNQLYVDESDGNKLKYRNDETDVIGTVAYTSDITGTIEKTADYTSLAAITGMSTGDLVYVQADGIAGLFQYDAILSATDDGGIVKDGWVRQYHGDLNAKWWGVTGDGVTDDQPNISTALHYAYDNSLDIFFPKGDYLFNTEEDLYGLKSGFIDDSDNKTFRLYGETGTKFTSNLTGTTGSFYLLFFLANDTDGVIIENIEFENTHGLTTNNINAIKLQSGNGHKNMVIRNCHFVGWTTAISINGAKNLLIENNRFTAPLGHDNARNDATPAVYISLVSNANGENEDVIIRNNYVEGYSGTDITTTTSQKAMDGFVYSAANQGGSNGLIIEGNTLLNLSEEAIAVNSYLAWDAAAVLKPIIIRNNYIDSTFPVGTTQTTNYGILADTGNLHIYGNTIKAAYNIMVYPTTQTIQMSDISIHSNKIHLTDDTVGVLKGIFLQGYIASTLYPLNNVSVHDNDIFVKDLTLPADTKLIHIADIGNSIIKNNNFFIENVTLGGFDLDIYDFGGDSNNIEYGGETIIGSYTNLLVNNGGNTGITNNSFNALNAEALDVTGNIAVSGTVDGRDIAADGLVLDGLVSGGDGLGPDGDKGDITVGASGTTLTIDPSSVNSSKIADATIIEADMNISNAPVDEYVLTFESTGNVLAWQAETLGPDGDKGDITVSGNGTFLNIDNNAVGSNKLDLTDAYTWTGVHEFSSSIILTPTDIEPTGAEGTLYFDNSENTLKQHNGTAWEAVGGGGSADGLGPDGDKGDITVGGTGTTLTIDAGSIIEPDLDADNAPSDGDVLTYDSTGTNFAWVTAPLGPVADTPTTVLTLDNHHGRYSNMGTANTNTTFTTAASPVLGGWCKVRINAATQPTVTGATLVSGATFIASTDMYMVVSYNGVTEQYYFIKIAP